jgi:glycosyltransferase involved in cell wall biosynthesis
MILGLDDRFDASACYLAGSPDGKNILDQYGKAIYLDIDIRKSKLSIIRNLTRFLKSERPVMLHCHKHKATLFGTMAAIFSGTPYVISHVHGMNRTRRLRTRLINWLLLKNIALVIGVSESVRKDILKTNWGLATKKVVTVWNGIDITPIDAVSFNRKLARGKLGIFENEFVFGSVGRLAKTKGHEYLLKAFSLIRRKSPDTKVVIIGDGPLRKELEEQARELGITQHVVFAGFRSDVPELLPGFDVFVLPSIAEGLSLALLEAMASKLPVIASDVGGIPEVFGDEDIGRLIPSKDIPALANAMLEICSLDQKNKLLLGENARKRIENEFNIDFMCRKLVGLYESLLTYDKG